MGLTGTIPPQLGNLSFLVSLNLSRNVFHGSLPKELGNLRNLQELNMDHNQITGVIPEEIGNLNNLKNLSMDNNQITGLLTDILVNKSSLEYLSVKNNKLSGFIPREIENFTMLKKLHLQKNTFTGAIPRGVSSLHKLEEIYLSFNSLNGSIPPGLFNISTLKDIGFTEYGTEGLVSTRCDVYSYGIMLMETFTRKRPSDEMFAGDFSLRRWVKDSLPDVLHQIVDPNILNLEETHSNEKLQCIASIMELALNCSAESSWERLNMTDVLAALTKIKLQVLTSCEGS